jgi:hypothetical protein
MNKSAQLKKIDKAFYAIPQIFHHYKTIGETLFNMNLEAERRHRKGFGRTAPKGFTANAAARLFAVMHLAQALTMPLRYKVTDILHVRLECLYAQAYATEHRAAILAAWNATGIDIDDLLTVDYSELMKD